jgi:serine/threonine protein kinase
MQVDEALMKEITILRKLKHCNNLHIIKIFDIFEKEGKWFIVMELC